MNTWFNKNRSPYRKQAITSKSLLLTSKIRRNHVPYSVNIQLSYFIPLYAGPRARKNNFSDKMSVFSQRTPHSQWWNDSITDYIYPQSCKHCDCAMKMKAKTHFIIYGYSSSEYNRSMECAVITRVCVCAFSAAGRREIHFYSNLISS